MSFKVDEVEVPHDEPFRYDLLNREATARHLTSIVRQLNEGGTVFIDAGWGQGKTTFIKMWSAYLSNLPSGEKFSVVEFNAWTSDYSETPFVPLSKMIAGATKEYLEDGTRPELLNNLLTTGKNVLHMIALNLASKATGGMLTSQNIDTLAGTIFCADAGDNVTIDNFRQSIGEVSRHIRRCTGSPLILIIDELDRCRPQYAIDMLETIKHLFSVDQVVYVLVVNLDQLAHAIRSVYGSEFDVETYLRRFRDVEFKLPDADEERRAFISQRFRSYGVREYLARTRCREMENRIIECEKMYSEFAIKFGFSLRDIEQHLKRLEGVYSILRDDALANIETFTLLVILRHLDADSLKQFVHGEISDVEYVNSVIGSDFRFVNLSAQLQVSIMARIVYGAQHIYGRRWMGQTLTNRQSNSLISIFEPDVRPSQLLEHEFLVNINWQSVRDIKEQFQCNPDNADYADSVMLKQSYNRLEYRSEDSFSVDDDLYGAARKVT